MAIEDNDPQGEWLGWTSSYPPWFNPRHPPAEPVPPPRSFPRFQLKSRIDVMFDIPAKLPPLDETISAVRVVDVDDYRLELQLGRIEEVPNSDFGTLLVLFEEQWVNYQTMLTEWNILKARWDEEQKVKAMIERKKLYEELRKEFENQ